jgi:hypothetical protein
MKPELQLRRGQPARQFVEIRLTAEERRLLDIRVAAEGTTQIEWITRVLRDALREDSK